MDSSNGGSPGLRHPIAAYVGTVFGISWLGGLALYAATRAAGARWGPAQTLAFFPVLIVSVAAAGLILTRRADGREGLRALRRRIGAWRLGGWYALVLLPPALIFLVLTALRRLSGEQFAPNFFPVGFSFGVAAGLLEEIGWTGYLFPRLSARLGWRKAGVLLGLLWGLWHLPVADYLGGAAPHGAAWPAFFLAFVLIVSALRVIICWAVTRTQSVLIAMLVHVSSTGSLVMLAPPHVTPAQEALWYAVYGAALWMIAGTLLVTSRLRDPGGSRPSGTVLGRDRLR